jgi:glycosyltransferase involved in cell wall biosynthesis
MKLCIKKSNGPNLEGGLRTKGFFKKTQDDKPLITVVTVVFNDVAHIEGTVLSIINQNYSNIDYIVIDGGSTDGTVNVIKKYESRIDYWVSEKDNGIYDAMNKGILNARGEYLIFINSADLLICIPNYSSEYKLHKGVPHVILHPVIQFKNRNKIYNFGRLTPPHQGILYSKLVFKHIGMYSTKYKLISDCLFFDRIRKSRIKVIHKKIPICIFDTLGLSSKPQSRKIHRSEFLDLFISNPTIIGLYRLIRNIL